MTTPIESLSGVTVTAVGVARIRANESRRPDRLFDDPLALALADTHPRSAGPDQWASRPGLARYLHGQVVTRTRFYDEWLTAAVDSGIRQLVLVAAGFDARAFRLPLPAAASVFEIDLPNVLEAKEQLITTAGLAPACHRRPVAADLQTDWPQALLRVGFDRRQRSAWLVEGLLVYLDAAAADLLLRRITDLAAGGSQVATERGRPREPSGEDSADPDLVREPEPEPERIRRLRALWRGGLAVPPEEWLDGNGWSARTHALDRLARQWGREVPGMRGRGFVTAVRD